MDFDEKPSFVLGGNAMMAKLSRFSWSPLLILIIPISSFILSNHIQGRLPGKDCVYLFDVERRYHGRLEDLCGVLRRVAGEKSCVIDKGFWWGW
ncbi:hypothetical protein OIU78_021034 [Salix suchowensis]|nr:hypothetical protein OIU78_021034 [Salix suchowensis]